MYERSGAVNVCGILSGDAAGRVEIPLSVSAVQALLADPRLSDDSRLMADAGRGEIAAFTLLVERHSPAMYRVALRMLGDGHEAEDVVQDCFARLWQKAPIWKPSGAGLGGWLYRVTTNLCFDRLRRSPMMMASTETDQPDSAPLADRILEIDETHRTVTKALAALPERYSTALTLCYYDGFSNAIAAEKLNMNVKSIESLLFRARRQLRHLLQESDISCRDIEMTA